MSRAAALLPAVLLGLLAGLGARRAAAEDPAPLDPRVRASAEQAFAYGRLGDVEALLGEGKAAVDREPLVLASDFWRLSPTRPAGARHAIGPSVSERRIGWVMRGRPLWQAGSSPVGPGAAPYPEPAVGEPEPYPVLSALVRDRIRRETMGASGLPARSPLVEVRDEATSLFVKTVMTPVYLGPQRDAWTEEERRDFDRRRDRIASLASRNRLLALGGVGVLLALAAVAAFVARPRGRSPAQGTLSDPPPVR